MAGSLAQDVAGALSRGWHDSMIPSGSLTTFSLNYYLRCIEPILHQHGSIWCRCLLCDKCRLEMSAIEDIGVLVQRSGYATPMVLDTIRTAEVEMVLYIVSTVEWPCDGAGIGVLECRCDAKGIL